MVSQLDVNPNKFGAISQSWLQEQLLALHFFHSHAHIWEPGNEANIVEVLTISVTIILSLSLSMFIKPDCVYINSYILFPVFVFLLLLLLFLVVCFWLFVFGCLFLVVFWCISKNVTLQMKLVSVRLVLELLCTVTWYTPQIDLDSLLNLADS